MSVPPGARVRLGRGLYAVLDADAAARRGVPLLPFARAVLAARPAAAQLRAKHLSPRDTLALLRELSPAARAAGVPLFANDRPDLALLAGADGVHVGQGDLPLREVQALAPGLPVGVSTHTVGELQRALAERPDYVAFGPIWETASKEGAEPVVGTAALEDASREARRAGIPLVAIGGVDLARAPELARLGIAAAAISALFPAAGLEAVPAWVARLHAALGGG